MRLYKLCTISWLVVPLRPLSIVAPMQKRLPTILTACVLTLGICPSPSFAQLATRDKAIQAVVNSKGKTVFTNNVADNPEPLPVEIPVVPVPAPPVPVSAIANGLKPALPAWAASMLPAATLAPPEAGAAATEIGTLVKMISLTYGIDPDLVSAVIKTESNYDQWAVSPKGAKGLMQLVPATGHRFGVEDPFDARQNIEGGVRYLKFLLEKFDGSVDLSLAAYNAGEGAVEKLGRVPPIEETLAYVAKIRSIYPKKSAWLLPLTPTAAVSAAAGGSPQHRRVGVAGAGALPGLGGAEDRLVWGHGGGLSRSAP